MRQNFKTAIRSIFKNATTSISTVISVFVSAIVFAIFFFTTTTINSTTEVLSGEISIATEIRKDATKEEIDRLKEEIEAIPEVKSARFSDKNDQLNNLIKYYGENGKIFERYKSDNPLNDVYYVTLKDNNKINQVNSQIEKLANVETSVYGGEGVEEFIQTLEGVKNISLIISIISIIIPALLISNAIKVSIDQKAKEIEIMRYVGAKASFIRRPFEIEGVLLSLLGIFLALIIITIFYNSIYVKGGGKFILPIITMLKPWEFMKQLIVVEVIMGALIGLYGAFRSIRKYLKI